jgi:propanediol dehydratase small subunit
MTRKPLGIDDYPLAETHPGEVRGARGRSLDELTLDLVMAGDVTMEDLRITQASLLNQAEVARAAGRPTLAANFERAAEMTALPQELIMRVYELLRPGRAKSMEQLLTLAEELRKVHGTPRLADFVEEAAQVYGRRGLYMDRY